MPLPAAWTQEAIISKVEAPQRCGLRIVLCAIAARNDARRNGDNLGMAATTGHEELTVRCERRGVEVNSECTLLPANPFVLFVLQDIHAFQVLNEICSPKICT